MFPSCGDESNAVGAAYLGYLQECARRGVAAAPQPFGPAYLGPVGDRRGGRGGHPRAATRGRGTRWRTTTASRSASPSCWSRTASWPAARAGWSSGRGRSATARSWPTRPTTGWSALINRMIKNRDFWMPFAPTVLRRAGGRLPRQPEGLRLALHDAGHADAPGGAGRASPPRSIPRTPPRGRRSSSATWNPEYHARDPRVRAADRGRRGAQHLVQPPRRAASSARPRTRWTPSSAPACRTWRSATGCSPRSNAETSHPLPSGERAG